MLRILGGDIDNDFMGVKKKISVSVPWAPPLCIVTIKEMAQHRLFFPRTQVQFLAPICPFPGDPVPLSGLWYTDIHANTLIHIK